jgi:monoamine oxidase
MDDSEPDESFLAFIERRFGNPETHAKREALQRATNYVSGFNAADPALVGVHWLVQGMRAEEKIQGDRAFRSKNGYLDLLDIFRKQISEYGVAVRTGVIVDRANWQAGNVKLTARNSAGTLEMETPRVLVTLPISLLKAPAGSVQFIPGLPRQKLEALDRMEMGKVIRVVLRFGERFWDALKPSPRARKTLSRMSFLLSQDEWFPTWWTAMPEQTPTLTGWGPFRSAERLSGQSQSFVVERSLQTLSGLLRISVQELENLLEAAHWHDWQNDAFSQGAYSYGKVGADGAQEILAAPLEGTLFFAGEAADTSGHNGTVHGAIASGYRAAREILKRLD